MKVKIIPFLLIRLTALYFLYVATLSLSEAIVQGTLMVDQLLSFLFIGTVIIAFLPLVFFVFFWWKADWLATKLAGRYADQEIATSLTIGDLQTTGFIIVGMFLFGGALPLLARDVGSLVILYTHPPREEADIQLINVYLHAGVDTVQFLIGIFLVFGTALSKRIVRKLRRG